MELSTIIDYLDKVCDGNSLISKGGALMSTKELQEKIVSNMKKWQKIEELSIESTGQIMEKTQNPVIKLVMEMINNDSKFHNRVQGFIADSLEKEAIVFSTDELGDIWDMIEHHIKLEKETVRLAHEALDALKGKKMLIQEYLINYLLEDEEKHNTLLEKLENIKSGIYPYA